MDGKQEIIPESLSRWLREKGKLAVALSGGVDSGVLLAAAVRVLGRANCLAVTAVPPYVGRGEVAAAAALARRLGVRHEVAALETPVAVAGNPPLRCYHCKLELFSRLGERARGLGFLLLADGTNADDRNDYRPGMRALKELGVASPWLDCGLGKRTIRRLGRALGLPPSVVEAIPSPCLLTRLEHGMAVDVDLLRRIEQAEEWLAREVGGTVRLRCLRGGVARIELEPERVRLLEEISRRERCRAALLELGFDTWSVDPVGYRSGSMNSLP